MKHLLVLSILFLSFTSSACWVSASQQISVQDDTLTVIQTAEFCVGSGSSCPPLTMYTISYSGSQICIDLFYNLNLVLPSFACTQIDTLREEFPYGTYDVIVKSNAITDLDTNLVEVDTTQFVVLSTAALTPLGSVRVYPNPANGSLSIVCDHDIDEVVFTDLTGRYVHKEEFSSQLIIEELRGTYMLHLIKDGRVIASRRVVLE